MADDAKICYWLCSLPRTLEVAMFDPSLDLPVRRGVSQLIPLPRVSPRIRKTGFACTPSCTIKNTLPVPHTLTILGT